MTPIGVLYNHHGRDMEQSDVDPSTKYLLHVFIGIPVLIHVLGHNQQLKALGNVIVTKIKDGASATLKVAENFFDEMYPRV